MANGTSNRLDFNRILTLLFIMLSAFSLFIVPIKLGSPYIDEVGLFVPTLIDLIFSTWPTLGICTIGLLLFLAMASHALMRVNVQFSTTKITLMLLLFLISCAFSISISVNKYASTINFMILCGAATGYFAAKYIFSMDDDSKHLFFPVFVAMLVGAIFISVNGIYQYFFGLDEMRQMINIDAIKKTALLYKETAPHNYALYQRLVSDRIFSTFVYPNSLAGYLCMIVPFVLELVRHYKKSAFKVYLWIACTGAVVVTLWFYVQSLFSFIPAAIGCAALFPVTFVAALILTASKGGIITFMMVIGLYLLILCIKKWSFRIRTVVLLAVAVLTVGIIVERTMLPGKIKSLEARVDYWKSAFSMIKEKPLFGYGLGTFGTVYPKYRIEGAEETQFAHNSYLQVWAETGLIGFISFIMIWGTALYVFVRKTRNPGLSFPHTAAGLAVAAFAFHSLVDFDFSIPALSFLAFYFLGIVDTRHTEKPLKLDVHKNKLIILLLCVLFIVMANKYITGFLDAQAYYDAAKYVYREERDVNQAVELLNDAIQINPSNPKLYFLLGSMYLNEGQVINAIDALEDAVARDQHRASYHYQLGKAYLQSGENQFSDKAIIEFSKAMQYNPHNNDYKQAYRKAAGLR